MLYACAAGFPRAAIDHCLHDDWDGDLLTAVCDPGSSIRNCCYHCYGFREPLAERYRLRPKAVPATCGVLSEASDVPVKPWLWPRKSDSCCEIAISLIEGCQRDSGSGH